MALLCKTVAAAFALATFSQQAAASAGRAASPQQCFQEYAGAFSSAGQDKCGPVIALAKCAAAANDAATQSTVDQIVSNYECDLSAYPLKPVISQVDSNLHMAVDDEKDVVFVRQGRAANSGTSVWDLKDRVEKLATGKMSSAEVVKQLKAVGDTVEQTLSLMEKSVKESAAELTADIKKQSSDLSGDVDKNLGAVRTQMAAVKTRLKDLLAKKIKELNDKRKASVAKMDTGIKSVQEVSGDCNYATHYKHGGKCVQLTDCNKGDEKFQYHGEGTNRQFPSYIWKKETKTTDRVCKYAAYRRFYSLSDHVYFHFVRWPAWQYPVYNEHALVAVCKQAGMKPWRDEGAWGCDPGKYMCDTWGYNLGGHDLMNKLKCASQGGYCYGHSGSRDLDWNGLGEDFRKLGFKANERDIQIITKQYHSSTYQESASWIHLHLDSSGRSKYQDGYHNGRPKITEKSVAVCAYGRN